MIPEAIEIKEKAAALLATAAQQKKAADAFEIDPYDFEDLYREALNEGGPAIICGYEYDAACALEEIDPTAYRCGLIDWANSLDKADSVEWRDMSEEYDETRAAIAELVCDIHEYLSDNAEDIDDEEREELETLTDVLDDASREELED